MSLRRNSKIYAEAPVVEDLYLGQAPPGSQTSKTLHRGGSATVISGTIPSHPSARVEEVAMHSSRAGVPDIPSDIPKYSESNHPQTRKKSISSADGQHDLSGSLTTDDLSATARGGKIRRKSHAALSISTTTPDTSEVKIDAPFTPSASMKATTPHSKPVQASSKKVSMIKDGTKRASSRLLIEKEKVIKNVHPDDVEDENRNGIDFDTCCIFIF